VSGFIL